MDIGKKEVYVGYAEDILSLGAELKPSKGGHNIEAHCPATVSRDALLKIGFLMSQLPQNGLGGDPEFRAEGDTLIISIYPD